VIEAQHKDAVLAALAERANIAQFVSFSPNLEQRHSRVHGFAPDHAFPGLSEAASELLVRTAELSVNVRSFQPQSPKSREFVYGLTSVADIVANVSRLAGQGLYTILNETIDIHDGGVSGVAIGDVVEFAPDDTPRCVEKPGTASLSKSLAVQVLQTVYGFRPALEFSPNTRVEFSLHPIRRGVRNEHTIIWELEEVSADHLAPEIRWPNRFSQAMGDKAYGLLIAHLSGLRVPRSTVIGRSIPPFSFGVPTGTQETWIRTCPRTQTPGKFTTKRGWIDPYQLLHIEDPDATAIASVIAQEGVDAQYSGAALGRDATPNVSANALIEGTAGYGDEFMVGRKARIPLPDDVVDRVSKTYRRAAQVLGPVRFEWVADESDVWIVQLHRGASESFGTTIVAGNPSRYRDFDVREGLEALRSVIDSVSGTDEGIALVGEVGITSHFGDVLRKARVPSIIQGETPAPVA
jgi:hypothetical protein